MLKTNKRTLLLFLLPAFFAVFATVIWPTIYTFYLAFSEGAKYFLILIRDPVFFTSLQNLGIFVLTVTIAELFLGIGMATFAQGLTARSKSIMQTIFIVPIIVTPIAVAAIWRIMYHPLFGLFNFTLTSIGLPAQAWLGSTALAMPSVMMIDIWQWSFFFALLLLAGLSAMPPETSEASRIDGASRWQIFRHIELPHLKDLIIVVLIIRVIDACKTFEIFWGTTGGGPGFSTMTLNVYGYSQTFRWGHVQYGAVISITLLLVLILSTIFLLKRLRSK
ncbi:MAG: sugar ABC transporter permease [Flavobacteriaceae bacterium]|nr:sugar ABC transporter permease [Flavobacteriaceae bacterium]